MSFRNMNMNQIGCESRKKSHCSHQSWNISCTYLSFFLHFHDNPWLHNHVGYTYTSRKQYEERENSVKGEHLSKEIDEQARISAGLIELEEHL